MAVQRASPLKAMIGPSVLNADLADLANQVRVARKASEVLKRRFRYSLNGCWTPVRTTCTWTLWTAASCPT